MKSIPFPLRVAAGIAVTTTERVRELPKHLAGFPVTVASQVLQASMRVQQHVTELAVKGDDVLSSFRPAEESPSWATFDEDLPADLGNSNGTNGANGANGAAAAPATSPVPAAASTASPLDPDAEVPVPRSANGHPPASRDPGGLPGYDELSLPQLRARLRTLTLDQLSEILDYERAHQDRPEFTGMLGRRISNVRKSRVHENDVQESDEDERNR